MSNTEKRESLQERLRDVRAGDPQRAAGQHAAGKSTARERIAALFDAGSFVETGTLFADANVICGYGTVHLRPVYCFAQDYISSGGAVTVSQCKKILHLLHSAEINGAPVVQILDSAGMRIAQGVEVLGAYSEIFAKLARLSGVCPLITLVLGDCRGAATALAEISDLVIMGPKGRMALHPKAVMNGRGEPAREEEGLFGSETMADQGVAALTASTEEEAIGMAVSVLELLPSCNAEDAPLQDGDDFNRLLPAGDTLSADGILKEISDDGSYVELYPGYGCALRTALARMGGRSVGLAVCDISVDEGRLNAAALRKAARFVRLCDCYQLPVITFVDTMGISVPGCARQGEWMRAMAQLTYAYSEATTAKLAVITGHAVGAAYIALGGKALSDYTLAWEQAVIAPVTEEVAVAALQDKALSAGEDRQALEAEYAAGMSARLAGEKGLVDEVVPVEETRKYLIAALEYYSAKRDSALPRKHGNLPL